MIIQPTTWFRTELGGFSSAALDDALNQGTETAELGAAAYSGRITFLPYIKSPVAAEPADDGFDDDFGDDFGDEAEATTDYVINSWFGASAYQSGDFRMLNGFLGLGIHEGVSLVAEISQSERSIEYTTLNSWAGLWYTPLPWLTAAFRVEKAKTTTANSVDETHALTGGLEFFPMPYVELRPEYRLVETSNYRFGQATLQIHLFY